MRWRVIGTEQLPDLAVGVEALKVPKGVIPDILVASCGVQKLPANVKLMVGLHGLCVASAKFVQTNGGESVDVCPYVSLQGCAKTSLGT